MRHRWRNSWIGWTATAVLLAIVAPGAGGLGIGIQTGVPVGGFFSVRDWVTPVLGVEAIIYATEENGDLTGIVTGRFLSWNTSRFGETYIAGGLTHEFPEGDNAVSAVAGLEFGVPFSRQITWNVEIGVSYAFIAGMSIAMGTGIHFYFNRP